jgi:hypothetical protein
MIKLKCKRCKVEFYVSKFCPNTKYCCECRRVVKNENERIRYKQNPDKKRKQNFLWKENNKQRYKEIRKECYENNKGHVLVVANEWRKNNKDKIHKYYKKYCRTDKGYANRKRKEYRRRERIKNNGRCDLSANDWNDLLRESNYSCVYCGIKFNNANPPTQDHIIPISKGGEHTKSNINPCCMKCNRNKSNK